MQDAASVPAAPREPRCRSMLCPPIWSRLCSCCHLGNRRKTPNGAGNFSRTSLPGSSNQKTICTAGRSNITLSENYRYPLAVHSTLNVRLRNRWPHFKALIKPSNFTSGGSWIAPDHWCERDKIGLSKSVKSAQLRDLFGKFQSDKILVHDYDLVYGYLADHVPRGALLEFGIAASRTHDDSPISADETVGASLHAWRSTNWFTHIFGIDFDERFVFQDEGITTFQADQYDTKRLDQVAQILGSNCPEGLSLIIDDAAHTGTAIINSFIRFFPLLTDTGFYVIEDLDKKTLTEVLPTVLTAHDIGDFALWTNLTVSRSNQLLVLQRRTDVP